MADPNDPNGNPLTDIAQILAQAAQGRALGKVSAGDLLLRQGSLANQMYGTALGAKSLEAALPSERMSQVARGDYAANAQDVTASGPERVMNNVIHFSGGLRPSAFGPATRAAGTKLAGLAGNALGNETMPTAPTLPQLPQSSLTDSLLSGAAGATGILGALAGSPGSGGSFDLGKLFSGIKNKLFPPHPGGDAAASALQGNQIGGEDVSTFFPGVEQGPTPSGVTPNLPGSQVDPMADYWAWLRQQQQGNGGGAQEPIPDGSGWGGE